MSKREKKERHIEELEEKIFDERNFDRHNNNKILKTKNSDLGKLMENHRKAVSEFVIDVLISDPNAEISERFYVRENEFVKTIELNNENLCYYLVFTDSSYEIFLKLVEKTDIHKPTSWGNILDWQCNYKDNSKVVSYLINHDCKYIPNNNYDIVIDLLKYGYFDELELLEKKNKIDYNKLYNDYDRPLISYFILNSNSEAIKFLVKKKRINLNVENKKGTSPLFWCAITGNIELADYLIENGAKPNQQTKQGETHVQRAKSNCDLEYVKHFKKK